MTEDTGKPRRGMDPAVHAKAMATLHAFLERRWTTKPMDPWAFQFQYLAGPIPMPCYAQINPDFRSCTSAWDMASKRRWPASERIPESGQASCAITGMSLIRGCAVADFAAACFMGCAASEQGS
jgi:hypothetical protein